MSRANDGLRLAFVDSWLRDRARGSGSAVGISGLAAGLRARGHHVERIQPEAPRGGAVERTLFNLSLPFRLDPSAHDLVVSFDLDGCFLDTGEVPRITCLKGVMADELRFESGASRLRLGCLSRLERRAARAADGVVVTSEYCREVVHRSYGVAPSRQAVVPEGIDLEAWRDLPAPENPRDGPVVLSVARQYPRKNTATLLRAFARVREERPDTVLRVVGGGPELARLRRLTARLGLEGTVRLEGEVSGRERVQRAYGAADVFCLPSLQEGFGIVFLEAMAAGLPIVAGDVAAVPEVVESGTSGLLVDPRDPGAVAGGLLRLLDDAGLRRSMGEAGRERVRGYGWPRVAARFLEAVRGLLPDPETRPEDGR